MSLNDPGRVKTKSDLIVALAEEEFLHFSALSVTTSLKIPGAVISRRVFTRPEPIGDMYGQGFLQCKSTIEPHPSGWRWRCAPLPSFGQPFEITVPCSMCATKANAAAHRPQKSATGRRLASASRFTDLDLS